MHKRMIILLFSALCVTLSAQDIGADRLYLDERYTEAIQVTLAEIEQDAATRDTYCVLCWSLIATGQYQQALDYGFRGFELNRYDPRLIEVVGEAYFYLGRNLEALQYFEEYAAMQVASGARIDKAYYFMGEIFIRLGEYNHADIAFSTALYHSRNRAAWWARLGYARYMAENYALAVEAYDEALTLDSGNEEARNGIQKARAQLGT